MNSPIYSVEDEFILDANAQELVLNNKVLYNMLQARFKCHSITIPVTKDFFDKFRPFLKLSWLLENYPALIKDEYLKIINDNMSFADWYSISRAIHILDLDFDLVEKHKEKIHWGDIDYTTNYITEEFIDRFSDKIDFDTYYIYESNKFSFNFIKKYITKLDMTQLINASKEIKIDDSVSVKEFLYSKEEREAIIAIYKQYKDLI